MANLTCLLKQTATILALILLTFLYYSVFLPIYLILLVHREVVIGLAKRTQPSWIPTSIVGGGLAVDSLNRSKIHCFSIAMEFDKPFDINQLRDRVLALISGNEYPELKCHFTRCLGISFLKPCSPSALPSVFVVNPTRDVQEANEAKENYIFQPFLEGRPLWQIMVLPNAKTNKVEIVLRTHHGLLDGLSTLRLLQAIGDPNPEEEAKLQDTITNTMKKFMPPLPWYSRLRIGLEFLFVTPLQLFYTVIKSLNLNMWTTSACSGNMIQHRQNFNSNKIRKIANSLGHNSNTLFSAALIGAVREEMKARGDSVDKDITLFYVLPSPKNVNKLLSNHLIVTFARIPISVEDWKTRLLAIDAMFQKMRRPAWILQCDLATKLIALLGGLLRLQTLPRYWTSGGWTNISAFGIDSKLKILGKKVTGVTLNGGTEAKGVPVVFGSTVLTNEIVLCTMTHDSIFPIESDFVNFCKRVEHELEIYEKIL